MERKTHSLSDQEKHMVLFRWLNFSVWVFTVLFAVSFFVTIIAGIASCFAVVTGGCSAIAALFRFVGHLSSLVGIGILAVTASNHRNDYATSHGIPLSDDRLNFIFPRNAYTEVPSGYVYGMAFSASFFILYFFAALIS